jgi:predicted nucleic acid-binding protein
MDAADLDAAIGDAERAFIDTSVCIAFHSAGEAAHPAARHLIRRIEDDDDPLVGYLSVITAAEMLVRPLRTGSTDSQIMHRFLRQIPNLHIVEVDFEIAQQAANVRALTRLMLPDALIVGTALLSGCEAIVTNDREWARRLSPLFPQFRWIYLGR